MIFYLLIARVAIHSGAKFAEPIRRNFWKGNSRNCHSCLFVVVSLTIVWAYVASTAPSSSITILSCWGRWIFSARQNQQQGKLNSGSWLRGFAGGVWIISQIRWGIFLRGTRNRILCWFYDENTELNKFLQTCYYFFLFRIFILFFYVLGSRRLVDSSVEKLQFVFDHSTCRVTAFLACDTKRWRGVEIPLHLVACNFFLSLFFIPRCDVHSFPSWSSFQWGVCYPLGDSSADISLSCLLTSVPPCFFFSTLRHRQSSYTTHCWVQSFIFHPLVAPAAEHPYAFFTLRKKKKAVVTMDLARLNSWQILIFFTQLRWKHFFWFGSPIFWRHFFVLFVPVEFTRRTMSAQKCVYINVHTCGSHKWPTMLFRASCIFFFTKPRWWTVVVL